MCLLTLISGFGIKHNLTTKLSTKARNFRTREKKKKGQNTADLHMADLNVYHEDDSSHVAQSTAGSTAVHYGQHSSYNAVLGLNAVSLQDL